MVGTNLNLIEDNTQTPKRGFFVASFIVSNVQVEAVVEGKITYRVDFEVSGNFTAITGSTGV